MLLKVRRQLMLMWNRGGLVITFILLILLAIALDKPQVPVEDAPLGDALTQEVGDAVYVLASSVPKNSFGWTEFPSTSTWRFSSSLTYQLEPGTEVAAPQAGDVSAFGEKSPSTTGRDTGAKSGPLEHTCILGVLRKASLSGLHTERKSIGK